MDRKDKYMGWSWTSPIMKPKEEIKAGDLVLDTTDNKIGLVVIIGSTTEEGYVYKEGAKTGFWKRLSYLEKLPAKTTLTIVQD